MSYRPRNSYNKDPRWMYARFSSACKCGESIKKGDRILYWPSVKKAYCEGCGNVEWPQFLSEAADEYAIGF